MYCVPLTAGIIQRNELLTGFLSRVHAPAACGCSSLFGMTTSPRRAKRPLIASTLALRALATAITLSSLGGMTIFASENRYASNAPLQPAAVATAAVATATQAPTTAPTTVTSTRRTVQRSVTSTTTTAVTRTKQS